LSPGKIEAGFWVILLCGPCLLIGRPYYGPLLWLMMLLSNPKTAQLQKKVCGPQDCCCERRCEIQSGGQEMAVMVS